jgi:hypothetical protein
MQPAFETLYATRIAISDSDLSDNTASPGSSFGIRIANRFDAPGAAPAGDVQATIRNNQIVGNQIGTMVDAGFPRRAGPTLYSGVLQLDLAGNLIAGSLTRKGITDKRMTIMMPHQNVLSSMPSTARCDRNSLGRSRRGSPSRITP